jgi:hypothetical protein
MRHDMPRVTMLFIVMGAGGAAFLSAVFALRAGLDSMALRYGLASSAGYLAFAGLIRAWIAVRRTSGDPEWALDVASHLVDLDLLDAGMALSPASARGGGAASWADHPPPVEADIGISVVGEVAGAVGGADEAWWLVVAAAMALGGLVAVVYVIYAAPLLLAEVALDAALFSAVYRKVRREDLGHWLGAVWRRTWAPAVGLILFMTAMGFTLQLAVPEARSIGDVLRALFS